MSDLRVVGLDPSLTRTGLCKSDGRTISLRLRDGRVDPHVPDWYSILTKANAVRDWAWPHMAGADLLVIEEPMVVDGHESSVGPLQALQWVLLQRCRAEGVHDRVLRLWPQQVQAFARNGVEFRSFHGMAPAEKKAAMEDLARDAGWAGPHAGGSNHDEGEAWWMWAVGRHVVGDPVVESTRYRDQSAREWADRLARYRRRAA
jgi:hypothetical protein